MAKAKQAPDINGFAEPYEWAAEVLLLRLGEVVSFGGAALVLWNVTAVHDMRVSLRRLRSSLSDFVDVIDEKQLKRVSKKLKNIADALGAVRDNDVAIMSLEKLAAESDDAPIKAGIEDLIEQIKKDRERSHHRLERSFSVQSLEDLRETFGAKIEDTLRQQELFRPASIMNIASEVIEARLGELCELGNSIYDPTEGQKLHQLRIAAKRLRYAIQLFAQCWPDETTVFAKDIAKLQTRLGEVHDCDAWIEDLSDRLKHNGKAKDQTATAAWLLSRFVGKRSEEYRAALELWGEWKTNEFVERLRGLTAQV